MTTIISENRNTLRQPMVVKCGFRESTDSPTSITPTNNIPAYEPFANVNTTYPSAQLMDLSGDGFRNNGYAQPIVTETDTYYRYGYISSDVALSDGTFLTPFGVTLTASSVWDYVTLELVDPDGNISTQSYQPTWSSTTCSVFVESWTPNTRCYIVGVYLGKAWAWNIDNLVSVSLDLRAVNTEINGDLEVSTIDIEAYEPTDYTEVIGRVPDGAPIWYTAGYDGDMSDVRYFYKTDNVEWENNVLTVHGQDATALLENKTIYAKYQNTTYANIPAAIVTRMNEVLASISFTTVGSAPTLTGSTSEALLFPDTTPRECISEYVDLFRDDDTLRVTYVDAGIPTLHIGDSGISTWTIYADEIGELKHEIEPNKNEVSATIYSVKTGASVTMGVDGTAGEIQKVTFDQPAVPSSVSISPTPTSWSVLSPYEALLVPAATTTYTVTIGTTLATYTANGDAPYEYNNGEKGFAYAFENEMQKFQISDGSLTKAGLRNLLNRSNILYQFTYRGNPHIQPRDVLNVQLATWSTNQVTVDGLYPDEDLYPSLTLYPNATYEYKRQLSTEWVTMTVESVELEHSEGGLTSVIRARKGAV